MIILLKCSMQCNSLHLNSRFEEICFLVLIVNMEPTWDTISSFGRQGVQQNINLIILVQHLLKWIKRLGLGKATLKSLLPLLDSVRKKWVKKHPLPVEPF